MDIKEIIEKLTEIYYAFDNVPELDEPEPDNNKEISDFIKQAMDNDSEITYIYNAIEDLLKAIKEGNNE